MTIHARKIIDAVQNSLLGDLVWRWLNLAILGGVATASLLGRNGGEALLHSVLVLVPLWGFAAWLLGALANRRPGPHGARPAEPRHANGFGAWSEPPEGGLRPPPFIRASVMALDAWTGSLRWVVRAALILAFLVIAFLALPVEVAFRTRLGLDGLDVRATLLAAAFALAALVVLLHWAADHRRILLAQNEASPLDAPG